MTDNKLKAIEFLKQQITKLEGYHEMNLATKTATAMWVDKVTFQAEFYERLKVQLLSGIV